MKKASPFTKAILTLMALTVIFFVTGTILALKTNRAEPGKNYRKSDPDIQKAVNKNPGASGKTSAYTKLGEIRVFTKPAEGSSTGTLLLIRPWFSYPENDWQLFEELSDKSMKIKNLFLEYFSSYTESQLKQKGELQIKEELLEIINGQLILGKLTALYFDTYIFF